MSTVAQQVRVYVPCDAAALSVGADAVARAIQTEAAGRGLDIALVRNGSRGALWLEPLVEVERGGRREAYGPIAVRDVAGLFDADFLGFGGHALALGDISQHDWMRRQQRLNFARVGLIDPLSLDDYAAHGGLAGLRAALAMPSLQIVQAVKDSGLRGRGGAGFPTGIKWQTVHDAPGPIKYVVCNADEGDSGTFADRMLMEGDPFMLIEGMTIAGIAVGATRGYIYLRSEYPHAFRTLKRAIEIAERAGVIGASVMGSDMPSTSRCVLARALIFAARKPRCWRAWKASAASCAPSRQSRPCRGCSASRRWSTTCCPSVPCRGSWRMAGGLRRLRHGAFTRHAADAAWREHPARRIDRARIRHLVARDRRGYRRRHLFGPSDPGGAGWWAVGRVFHRETTGHADGLRGARGHQGDAGPWRHRGVRRSRRYGEAGAFRVRILREGNLRQMHAVPHRRDAWRGDGRQRSSTTDRPARTWRSCAIFAK